MLKRKKIDVHGCSACGQDHAGQKRIPSDEPEEPDHVIDQRVIFRPLATAFPHEDGGEPYRWTGRCPTNERQLLMRMDDDQKKPLDVDPYEPWPGGRHGGENPKKDVTDAQGRPI